jgi:hypothetical protein
VFSIENIGAIADDALVQILLGRKSPLVKQMAQPDIVVLIRTNIPLQRLLRAMENQI